MHEYSGLIRLLLPGLRHPRGTDRGSALQFIPGKLSAFKRPLQRLQQNHGEQLSVGEALQPNVAEQPEILMSARLPSFESESDGGRDEVDHQKQSEVHHQLMET